MGATSKSGSLAIRRTKVRYSLIVWALLGLLITGCEQKVYEKIYAQPTSKITCLRLKADNPITEYLLRQEYHFTTDCPYTLKTVSHFISTCTSAKTRALGSDFDGYLRLELWQKGRLLYRNQIDFKGCLDKTIVHTLFKRLQKLF